MQCAVLGFSFGYRGRDQHLREAAQFMLATLFLLFQINDLHVEEMPVFSLLGLLGLSFLSQDSGQSQQSPSQQNQSRHARVRCVCPRGYAVCRRVRCTPRRNLPTVTVEGFIAACWGAAVGFFFLSFFFSRWVLQVLVEAAVISDPSGLPNP